MRKENECLLGTTIEIAEEITRKYLETGINADFTNIDFAIVDLTTKELKELDLEKIRYSASGWYGIKRIETGFSNDDLELFADYYGGGCGVYDTLYDGLNPKESISIVEKMIIKTLSVREFVRENDILIAELRH